MEERKEPSGLLLKVAKNPLVILISLTVAVVALILMVIFYFVSQEERELVYAVNPIKTQIITMGKVTGLEIIHNGINLGDTDITAARVAIWSSGDLSIKPENILKKVVIYTVPPVKILEVSILKNLRSVDITGFVLEDTTDTLANGKVPIAWRILEKNDGANIQLIYLGSPDVEVHIDGAIEGFGELKQIEDTAQSTWFSIIVALLTVFLSALAGATTYYAGRNVARATVRYAFRARLILLPISVLLLLILLLGFLYLYSTRSFGPPFGF